MVTIMTMIITMILAGLGLRRGRHRRMVQKAGDVLHVRELHATYEENDRKVLMMMIMVLASIVVIIIRLF